MPRAAVASASWLAGTPWRGDQSRSRSQRASARTDPAPISAQPGAGRVLPFPLSTDDMIPADMIPADMIPAMGTVVNVVLAIVLAPALVLVALVS